MPRLWWRLKATPLPAEAVRDGFRLPRFLPLRLDRMPPGIDSLHIDVALGPALSGAVAAYVGALVREQVQRLWDEPVPAFSDAVAGTFREMVQEHHLSAVQDARAGRRIERVQLFQLAMLKLMLGQIDTRLTSIRVQLEDKQDAEAHQSDASRLRLHDQAVVLGRHAAHLRYRVAHRLLRDYMQLERGGMRNLRQSMLGVAWPVAEAMLGNPLLQLGGVGGPRDFSRLYPILLLDEACCRRVGACIFDALVAWLPEYVTAGSPTTAAPGRVGSGRQEVERRVKGLCGQREIDELLVGWVDGPENALALLGGADADWPSPGPWKQRGIARLQRQLSRRLGAGLDRAGLMRAVSASYELAAIYPSTGLVGTESLLFDYLRGELNRRELSRRLEGAEGCRDPAATASRIDELRRAYNGSAQAGRPQTLSRIASDFLRLRRDLKLAWHAYRGMDQLRLLADGIDLRASLGNNTLQVFCREALPLHARGSVVGHVIVRADIHGVARLTAQMRRRRLDPAAHFRRYLYAPLDNLIAQFGAQKVALGADTLNLLLLEHGGMGAASFAVARACCVAGALIRLADAMNAEHERLDLQRLEFGLGVAYAEGPPVYLYDDKRRVTVSAAMRRAGVLASCHGGLRESVALAGARGLCVARRALGAQGDDPGSEALARYNVNAIELDADAFARLNVEIVLRRLTRGGTRPTTLYVGRCTDLRGAAHGLLVRQRRAGLWLGRQLVDAGDRAQPYYEVIADARLISQVSERLGLDMPVAEKAG